MSKIEFLQIIKCFYKNKKEVLCNNKRFLPAGSDFDDLKQAALKYGYNYTFDSNHNLIIKLTDRQLSEINMIP